MKNVYKIEYRGTTYDCWGRSEWDYWRNYENKVYSTREKAEDVIRNLDTNSGDNQYRVVEVDIDIDDWD